MQLTRTFYNKLKRESTLQNLPVFVVFVNLSIIMYPSGSWLSSFLNIAGQDIFKQTINNQSSSLTQTVDLPSAIKPGVYNLVVTGDDYRESKMFIVQ